MKKILFIAMMVSMVTCAASGQLAGYWAFDDGSGLTAADSSGNGKAGSLYAVDGSNYPQWIVGHNGTGGALQFNAATTGAANSNRLVIPLVGTDSLANLGEAFTIAMWVRRDAVTTFIQWPSIAYTNAYDIQLALDPTASSASYDSHDYFSSQLDTNWQYIDLGASTPEQTTGIWYHLAITYDGNYLRKYINGVLVAGLSVPTSFSLTATTDLLLAARSNATYFEGALDDVAIWSGKYLAATQVAALADGTATPLTVVETNPNPPITGLAIETDNAWTGNGWKLFWDEGFNQDAYVDATNIVGAWWFPSLSMPGTRTTVNGLDGVGYCKWWVRNEADYSVPSSDVTKYGIEWIDPSWSGREPNVVVLAAYITPGILLCQNGHGYQGYDTTYSWTQKNFFKTYARVAAVNAENAWLRVRVYTYDANGSTPETDPNVLNFLGQVYWPLGYAGDYKWQELKYAFPKPTVGTPDVWIDLSIVNGANDTVVYIDEFNPVSDQTNTLQDYATYLPGDINKDAIVNYDDLGTLAANWLASGSVTEPRNTGMLVNGDFYADLSRLGANDSISVDPTGWTFSGTGDTGIQRTGDKGLMNSYMLDTPAPMGGSVSAYLINDSVLSQTTAENAVPGRTYYAMAYVMTDSWDGWKDIATMSLDIDGSEVASFSRPMSLNGWRPVYGTYTAVAADAGKPITVNFSYADADTNSPGYMYVGYAYLDDVMPAEWPEGRDNALVNGGFEDLSALDANVPAGTAAVANSIRKSDNSGAWFVDGVPAPPGWLYEVPAGFSLANKGGMFASGQLGSPIPSPGMNDVSVYLAADLPLGQIIGALINGTKYYFDMACGVVVEPTFWGPYSATWPSPAPQFHIELWRIPSGVTDPAVIHTGITTNLAGYVKIAEAVADSTGDIKGGEATPPNPPELPKSRWQLVGTSYTATSADTNVYVRIYGTNGVAVPHPSFAFSDVYVSTDKRLVPGGAMTFEIEPGLQYDVAGPYSCYHAGLMGLAAPAGDLNSDCEVNLFDFAILANNWVKDWYTNITGIAP